MGVTREIDISLYIFIRRSKSFVRVSRNRDIGNRGVG